MNEQKNSIIVKIKALKEDNIELDKKYKQLQKQFSEMRSNCEDLQNNYQRLKLAKAFGQSEEDKKKAYQRLSSMIADIDKCLVMLNE
jgi:phage shock protein A